MKKESKSVNGILTTCVHEMQVITKRCRRSSYRSQQRGRVLAFTGSNTRQSRDSHVLKAGSSKRKRSPLMITTLTSMSMGIVMAFTSCSPSQVRAPERYHYQFIHGKTALVQGQRAWAPRHAPMPVHHAMEAGNSLQGRPYRYGGGHRSFDDTGYDCSGTVSYVLNRAGLLNRTMTSSEFMNYGEAGHGRWITIYAREGHVFMTVAGLRIDTGGTRKDTGPRWKPSSRKTSAFVVRHPPGL